MKFVPPAVQAARAARSGTHAELLVWVKARIRATGVVQAMGLWTGADHQVFTIGGQAREYYGAGAVLQVPPIQATVGIEVKRYTLSLSAVSPEVELLIRGYDPRLCPIEVHRAEFDAGGNLLGAPERVLKGTVSGSPIITPAIGGSATASLEVESSARSLTRYGTVTKSDQVQRQRGGDRFRRFSSITKAATTYWGEHRRRGDEGVVVNQRGLTP